MKTKTKIKVVEVNSKGLVEITPEKLERMLNEAYLEGYNDNTYVSLSYGLSSDSYYANSASTTDASIQGLSNNLELEGKPYES